MGLVTSPFSRSGPVASFLPHLFSTAQKAQTPSALVPGARYGQMEGSYDQTLGIHWDNNG
jgi:hypothetical protein